MISSLPISCGEQPPNPQTNKKKTNTQTNSDEQTSKFSRCCLPLIVGSIALNYFTVSDSDDLMISRLLTFWKNRTRKKWWKSKKIRIIQSLYSYVLYDFPFKWLSDFPCILYCLQFFLLFDVFARLFYFFFLFMYIHKYLFIQWCWVHAEFKNKVIITFLRINHKQLTVFFYCQGLF